VEATFCVKSGGKIRDCQPKNSTSDEVSQQDRLTKQEAGVVSPSPRTPGFKETCDKNSKTKDLFFNSTIDTMGSGLPWKVARNDGLDLCSISIQWAYSPSNSAAISWINDQRETEKRKSLSPPMRELDNETTYRIVFKFNIPSNKDKISLCSILECEQWWDPWNHNKWMNINQSPLPLRSLCSLA
jgi:hypothetical protein